MDNIKGKKILLDPMGGLYNDERIREWRYQKKPVAGIPGDIITSEVAAASYDILRVVGADVFATRCLRRSTQEVGESRQPLFHESAGQYLRYCRVRPSLREDKNSEHLPPRIWNDGQTSLERDAQARINFAKHIGAELLIAIDLTNYATDEGLEVRHNGVGEAQDLAESVIREVAKRTRRKPRPVGPLLDEEKIYSGLAIPALVLNCGSTFDPFTVRLLKQVWYREYISLGIFAGIWKHYVEPVDAIAR
jgi:hypothetical protein